MLTTNTAYDTENAKLFKTPLYTVDIAGVDVSFCNRVPETPTKLYLRYLDTISGFAQTVKPEKGTATIGSLKIVLTDVGSVVTNKIRSHATNLHRAKVVVKAGYKGMNEADLLTIATYWVTSCKRPANRNAWVIDATDPQKWLQKTIFRNASDSSPVTLWGNPINILLEILTSSATGNNSDYDLGDDDRGCGLDSETCDIAGIESVRDRWYWGSTHNMNFTITEKLTAKDFIEKELLKLLGCYPSVTGDGKYKIIRFQPPMASGASVQEFTEDKIIGVPPLDLNFDKTINQIDFFYDHDGSDYATERYFVDSASFSARGNAAKPLKIESKGLDSDVVDALRLVTNRKRAVFQRYAIPPVGLSVKTFFSYAPTEAGDVVPLTHSGVPDVGEDGTTLSSESMEVTSRSVDWKNGRVAFKLLQTGFGQGTYSNISPSMTITAASSSTAFTVSVSDAAKWQAGWESTIVNQWLVEQATTITILTIDTDTGAITCDDIGVTPTVGWIVVFADYDDATAAQQKYGYIADTNNYLGAADEPAHLLVA